MSRPDRLLTCLLVGGLLAAGSAFGAEQPESSESCGACHRDIYLMWQESAHAQAFEDPFFLEPLARIESAYGADQARQCLGCHAPMAGWIGDPDLELAISREGVNCEFCHGIVSVEMGERGPVPEVKIGSVKRGTIPGAESRGHDVAFSELHAESLVCAPCHEHKTAAGVPIMTTYSEWQSSSAAERNETCQTCHMSLVDSDVVDPRIKRDSGASVNLHKVPGGHSLEQLNKAIRVRLRPKRIGDELEVAVRLRNHGAGHAVPTGMPGRRVILRIDVRTSEGKSYREEKIYEKRFVDAAGERVDHVADLFFAEGLRMERDTRLAADEIREERFLFPVPPKVTAWVELKLNYEHSPWGEDDNRVWLTFYTETEMVRRGS